MSEDLFRVVFDGSLTGEFDSATAKKRFGKLFHLATQRVDLLFSGREFVIKNNITEEKAMEFMIKVSEAGCECYVQEMPDENEPDYDELRTKGERRLRYRRPPRTGAMVPDRRMQIRRKKDKKYFLDTKKHHQKVPLAFQSYPVISEDS
ncbi:MAG: hypothetical protein CMQ20_15780 [Gammaproteobacteria bacterium]|jgi:hypothetical protein|nr:hypothetical protein [Gammaproteobacteria bacterium]|tara:strand:+ start:253 stop:699 length:447 start_codon:yes stop_codon:yes gene_type:complete